MPLSTTSSDASSRAPRKSWPTVWVVALLVSLIGIPSIELLLRADGHMPSVTDTLELWAFQRRLLGHKDRSGEKTVALLGASQITGGFSLPTFKSRFPEYHIAQLATHGSALAVLKDLADDDTFRGRVIWDTEATLFLSEKLADQQEYTDYNRTAWNIQLVEPVFRAYAQDHLAMLSANDSLVGLVATLVVQGKLPAPRYTSATFERSRRSDYRQVDNRDLEGVRENFSTDDWHTPPFDKFAEDVAVVEEYVTKIQSRGGRVAFVRFPTSEKLWEAAETFVPRSRYWDYIADTTSAATVHFKDVEGLSGFYLPDMLHLDVRDAPAFTDNLLDELIRIGFFDD